MFSRHSPTVLDPSIEAQEREVSQEREHPPEREYSKVQELADSIFLECKQSRPTPTLETAIYLLRKVLDQRPPSHPLRSDALHHLSRALLTRFHQWGWITDVDEAIRLIAKATRESKKTATIETPIDILKVRNNDTTSQIVYFDGEEWSEMTQLAITSLTEFCQSVESSSINTAILLYHDLLLSRSPTSPNRARTLFNLSDALIMRFQLKGRITDLEDGISRLREATHLRSPPDPERLRWLLSLSTSTCMRYNWSGQQEDFEEASSLSREAHEEDYEASKSFDMGIDMLNIFNKSGAVSDLDTSLAFLRTSLSLRPAPHPLRSGSLETLASALWTRFQKKGQLGDLEESIAFHREALVLFPAPHVLRSASLNKLAGALSTRFKQKGRIGDLEESIALYREALVLRPAPHPLRATSLNNLAGVLSTRFEQKGQLADLEESIAFYQVALALRPAPHPLRSTSLNNVASALWIRFQQNGEPRDLEESIALHREALILRPAPHPLRSGLLKNLASALSTRFEQKGQLGDLEESISLHRETLIRFPARHPLRSTSLNNLANSLSTRFEQKGQLGDLEECIAFHREALVLRSVPHVLRSTSLNNLAHALSTRFKQKGQLGDLEESIAFHQEALVLRPASHPFRDVSLNNLAGALSTRFKQKGQPGDLEESISLYREAMDLRPTPHPLRATSFNNLAGALSMRFEQKGQLGDLEESIAFHREALVLRPAPHPLLSTSLNNLAGVLSTRFEKKCQLGDLEESIALYREALALFPVPHPLRSSSLNNLASVLWTRFEQKGHFGDLEESIAFHREALVLFLVPHPLRSTSINNLANALSTRFEQKGQLEDLEESIAFHREALVLRPAPHPDRSSSLNNLAGALWMLFEQKGQLADLEESMISFCDASTYETASVIYRFGSSRRWAHRAASIRHSSTMEAYQYTINLLPRLASLDLKIQQRQESLSRAGGLACDACSYAIHEGQFGKAVEFLSAGRAVFWAQALQLRTPFDELQSSEPQLADKLRTISKALEAASTHDSPRSTLDNSQKIRDLEKEAMRCRILNDDWNHTLENVRKLEGFEDFLLPKSISKLEKASSNGPVIMLNATTSGCDALVLMQNQVKHIPLRNISIEVARILGDLIRMSLSSNGVHSDIFVAANNTLQALLESTRTDHRLNISRIPTTGYMPKDPFEKVLETLWFTVARPIIDGLNLKKGNNLPRIWWCPAGPFSFLPIHAAGTFRGDHQECFSDYAISSYIPTLDALLNPPPPQSRVPKTLAVIQPEIPGDYHLNLPHTVKEMEMIERHVPKTFLTKLGTEEAPTSVKSVLTHLPNVSFAHFACHGSQNLVNPLDSALILGDGGLKVREIMQLDIKNASLAFLSACETAKGDENAPDEAMHLAATMLFAGFRGVVGTMWTIYDEDAPEVADVFYHHIFGSGQEAHPDATKAAQALHVAVKKLRTEKNVSFRRWIPFIHLGL